MEISEIMETIKVYADKAIDQFGKAGKAAAAKTGNAVQRAKIKYGIAEIESKRKDIYIAMGEKVYMKYLEDGIKNELFADDYDKIDELNNELNDLEIKLAACRETVKCAECGSYNDENNDYCAKCGAKLEKIAGEEEATIAVEDDTVIEVEKFDTED